MLKLKVIVVAYFYLMTIREIKFLWNLGVDVAKHFTEGLIISKRENYIFVSYSHADAEKVFPILYTLQFAGYRVWYDEGIQGGENWRKIIASKIQDTKCKDFLVFSSEHSIESRHVKAEINLALNLDKKITTVRLDSAMFDMDLEMYLTNNHYLEVSENRTLDEEIVRAMDDTTRVSR